MDIKKDIQNHHALNTRASNGMESFSISLSKKSERLATAMYLVTNFLSDTEPLKSRLRTLSLDLVRDASNVRYNTISIETNVLEGLRVNIGETLGLLELALIAGLVSEMNFSILKREYASLRDAIEIKKASRESRSDTVLGDTFFGSSFGTPESSTKATFSTPSTPEHSNFPTELGTPNPRPDLGLRAKGRVEGSDRDASQGHSIGQKDTTMSLRMSDTKTKSVPGPSRTKGHMSAPTITQEARRTRILKLIKDNREVTIKDITTYFPELSEKTIQRELVSLTMDGVLKKSGERRWSRYALA